MPKAYTSRLSRAQFELIEPLLPKAKPGGRPRSVDLFVVLNTILYVVVQGCKRRDIPGDLLPWSTAYTYSRNWRNDGPWSVLHERVRCWVRADAGHPESPSETILDSQSVWCIKRSATMRANDKRAKSPCCGRYVRACALRCRHSHQYAGV